MVSDTSGVQQIDAINFCKKSFSGSAGFLNICYKLKVDWVRLKHAVSSKQYMWYGLSYTN